MPENEKLKFVKRSGIKYLDKKQEQSKRQIDDPPYIRLDEDLINFLRDQFDEDLKRYFRNV